MATITARCDTCGTESTLPANQFVLFAAAATEPAGTVAHSCPACSSPHERRVTTADATVLILAGVSVVPAQELDPHPESGGEGAPFTADDLLDLHQELDGDSWWATLADQAQRLV